MRICYIIVLLLASFTGFTQEQTTLKIHFDFDKYDITPAGAAALDSVIVTNSKSSNQRYELYGHCDLRGSIEYNELLSQKRVSAVENYLLNKGVAPAQLSKQEGFGERRPLSAGSTEEDHAINRRVELVINYPEEKPAPVIPTVEQPAEKPAEKPNAIPIQQSLEKTIQDTATKAGSKIILRNINFYGGRDILLEISQPALQELVQVMKNNPKLVIRIDGHICCMPGDVDGTDLATGMRNLSVARARAVYEHLIRNGISRSRLSFMGWGHRNPIYPYPERSAREQTMNRRVEIFIVSK